jgi:hypothetical protein
MALLRARRTVVAVGSRCRSCKRLSRLPTDQEHVSVMNYAPNGKRRLKGSQGSGWWMFRERGCGLDSLSVGSLLAVFALFLLTVSSLIVVPSAVQVWSPSERVR